MKSSETRETFEVQLSIPTTISYRREADPPPLSSSTPLDTDTPPESIKSIFIHLLSGYAFFLPTPFFFRSTRYPIAYRIEEKRKGEEETGGGERGRDGIPGSILEKLRS